MRHTVSRSGKSSWRERSRWHRHDPCRGLCAILGVIALTTKVPRRGSLPLRLRCALAIQASSMQRLYTGGGSGRCTVLGWILVYNTPRCERKRRYIIKKIAPKKALFLFSPGHAPASSILYKIEKRITSLFSWNARGFLAMAMATVAVAR